MNPTMRQQFTADGRLRGAYVYMLLCQFENSSTLHVKVGRSSNNPLARLSHLATACPIEPSIIAIAEVATVRKSCIVEHALHVALKQWHTHLEWFTVQFEEKSDFNAAWRGVFKIHSHPSRRLDWVQFSVPELFSQARQRSAMRSIRVKKRGRPYRDFLDHARTETPVT